MLRMLIWRFGLIDGATESQVCFLSLSRFEDLGEALLEFRTLCGVAKLVKRIIVRRMNHYLIY
jgi:Domain of unknown function (DUF4351)